MAIVVDPKPVSIKSWGSGGLSWAAPDPVDQRYWGVLAAALIERYTMVVRSGLYGLTVPEKLYALAWLAATKDPNSRPVCISDLTSGAAVVIRKALAEIGTFYIKKTSIKEGLTITREEVTDEDDKDKDKESEGEGEGEGEGKEGVVKVEYKMKGVSYWTFSELCSSYPDICEHPRFPVFRDDKDVMDSQTRFLVAAKHCIDELHVLSGDVFGERREQFRINNTVGFMTGGVAVSRGKEPSLGDPVDVTGACGVQTVWNLYGESGRPHGEHYELEFNMGYVGSYEYSPSEMKARILAQRPISLAKACSDALNDIVEPKKEGATNLVEPTKPRPDLEPAIEGGDTVKWGKSSDIESAPYYKAHLVRFYALESEFHHKWYPVNDGKPRVLVDSFLRERVPFRLVTDSRTGASYSVIFRVNKRDKQVFRYITKNDSEATKVEETLGPFYTASVQAVVARGSIFVSGLAARKAKALVYHVPRISPKAANAQTWTVNKDVDSLYIFCPPSDAHEVSGKMGEVSDPEEFEINSPDGGAFELKLKFGYPLKEPDISEVRESELKVGNNYQIGYEVDCYLFFDVGGTFRLWEQPESEKEGNKKGS